MTTRSAPSLENALSGVKRSKTDVVAPRLVSLDYLSSSSCSSLECDSNESFIHEDSKSEASSQIPQAMNDMASDTKTSTYDSSSIGNKRSGRTKLIIDGYEYTRSNTTMRKISYRCSFYRKGCRAKLFFMALTMEYDFSEAKNHTCHPPGRQTEKNKIQAPAMDVTTAMRADIDELSLQATSTPIEIWNLVRTKYIQPNGNIVLRAMTKTQAINRVQYIRSRNYGADETNCVLRPPLCRVKDTSLCFIQFHHVWSSQKNDGAMELEKLIGWAHPALVSLLRYTGITLFIDGTFRIVPHGFKQCVVVMVFDKGTQLYIPIFYVLATSKTYDCYWNLLQFVSNACGGVMKPAQVVCDFEQALINAVKDWFTDVDVVGCYFHFKQACSRKMVKCQISRFEMIFANQRGVLDMLCVIPKCQIENNGINWVKEQIALHCIANGTKYSAQSWERFWKYFTKTWLIMFPPAFWNVSDLAKDLVARTNNPLERYNRVLNSKIAAPHPSMHRFVEVIEANAREYVCKREDVLFGREKMPKRKEILELPEPIQFC